MLSILTFFVPVSIASYIDYFYGMEDSVIGSQVTQEESGFFNTVDIYGTNRVSDTVPHNGSLSYKVGSRAQFSYNTSLFTMVNSTTMWIYYEGAGVNGDINIEWNSQSFGVAVKMWISQGGVGIYGNNGANNTMLVSTDTNKIYILRDEK